MTDHLFVGVAEVDITPPGGTALAGEILPRKSEGRLGNVSILSGSSCLVLTPKEDQLMIQTLT